MNRSAFGRGSAAAAVLLAVLLLSVVVSAQAAPGKLDPTFGKGGKVTTTVGARSGASAVALQSNGKIVAVGWWASRATPRTLHGLLARYASTGASDRHFGKGGLVKTADWVHALTFQADGKIVAIADANAIVRRNRDGTLDSSFGTNGSVQAPFGSASGLALQTDGKILVVGTHENGSALARYDPDGSLDSSFGAGGVAKAPKDTFLSKVAVQPDGKILAAGGLAEVAGPHMAVVRYESDGTLDTSFGTHGIAKTYTGSDFGGSNAIALQPDGKIVQLGNGWCQQDCGGTSCLGSPALARYNGNGSPDTTFSGDGVVYAYEGLHFCEGDDLAIQADGKIVVAGNIFGDTLSDVSARIVRFNADGTVDQHFSKSGDVTRKGFAVGGWGAVVVQADGKIVVGGSGQMKRKPRLTLLRLLSGEEHCNVPSVKGRRLRNAKRVIRRAYCSVGHVRRVFSSWHWKGRVISQKPKPGAQRRVGAKVRLVVGEGPRRAR